MATIYVPSQEGSTPLSEISICKEEASAEPSIHAVEPTYTIESTYAVEKIGDMDNAGYVATWKLRLNRLLPLSSVCAIAAYWLYFAFRVRYTVAAQELRHTVYPVAWLFISIELGVACKPPDILRIFSHGCLLMRISYSTSSANSTIAMFLDQTSPPP